ncbi:hypothetical protein [Pleionea sediminis]|uniref:hypothetical protein n=1 Tax=Pleionea sediminis TaxID=2569479 RepID=UPI0011849C65|nr:hypothetical protein [Pleionea sediminis]
MSTTFIITLIIAILVVAVAASGYFQYREQQKAEKRQKLSKFRYRARQGQDLYDKFYDLPIGGSSRLVILQYIAQNLQKALNVEPSLSDLSQTLDMIKQKITTPEAPADKQKLRPPSDPQELVVLMGRFKNLMRFIHKIGKTPGIDITAASNSLTHLKAIYLNLQTHTFIGVAKKRASEKNFVQALQYLENAKKLLLRQDISSPETQQMLKDLETLTNDVKSQRTQPQTETIESIDNEEEGEGNNTDDLFQPKKKW